MRSFPNDLKTTYTPVGTLSDGGEIVKGGLFIEDDTSLRPNPPLASHCAIENCTSLLPYGCPDSRLHGYS